MMRWAVLFTLLFSFFALCATGEDKSPCTYVIKDVAFENTKGLTSEQVEKLRAQIVGRCYDPAMSAPVSTYVYDQLREWGYREASVYEPSGFRIEDQSMHPAPISFAIDFRLSGFDTRRK